MAPALVNRFLVLIFISFVSFTSYGQNKRNVTTYSLLNNSNSGILQIKNQTTFNNVEIIDIISIHIPKELKKMSEELLVKKYQKNIRPSVAYSNEDVSVTFSFNSIPQTVSEQQLSEFLPLLEQQFQNVYPNIKWLTKKLTKVSGKSFIEFEFISHKTIKDVYSLIYMTVIDEKLFISAFNCTLDHQSKWESLAKESMNSIKEIKTKN